MDMKTNETSEATQTITEDIQENKTAETTNPDTIADRIRLIRTNAGLSQQQFADRIMVTRAAVSKWENGSGIPSVDSCQIIAREFNVSCDYILLASNEMTAPAKKPFTKIWKPETQFWKAFSKLSFILIWPALIMGLLMPCIPQDYSSSYFLFSGLASGAIMIVMVGSASWGYLQDHWKKGVSFLSMVGSTILLTVGSIIYSIINPPQWEVVERDLLLFAAFAVCIAVLVLIGVVRYMLAKRKADKVKA